jgi:hypothetical protein|tara:strand:+ start:1161 stop:1463 length:303 start_codon:yes stop_codon:yes gene_type:complete
MSKIPIPKYIQDDVKKAIEKKASLPPNKRGGTGAGDYTAEMLSKGYYTKQREGKIFSYLKRSTAEGSNHNMTPKGKLQIRLWGGKPLLKLIQKKRKSENS